MISVILYLSLMTTTIHISSRGTLTLPKPFRMALGIEGTDIIMAEQTEQGVFLKPVVAFPVEMYTDERIAEFDKADAELERHLRKRH